MLGACFDFGHEPTPISQVRRVHPAQDRRMPYGRKVTSSDRRSSPRVTFECAFDTVTDDPPCDMKSVALDHYPSRMRAKRSRWPPPERGFPTPRRPVPPTVGGGMVLVMHNQCRLSRTLSAAAKFFPDISHDSVLLLWRKDARKEMRVPKLSTLRSGREKSPPQFVCIHLQQCLPALCVILGHKAPRSLQVKKVPRFRAYPAVFSRARRHAIEHDLEPSKSHSVHPVLMIHLAGAPRLSPIWTHGFWSRPDHDQFHQVAWLSLPGRRVRLSQPSRPRTCPFRERP